MKKLKLENPTYKELLRSFTHWLDILGYAETTVYGMPIQLQEFFYYLEKQRYENLQLVTIQTIQSYYRYLQERSNQRQGGGLSKSYLNKHQQTLKKFQKYLHEHGYQGLYIHLKYETNPSEEKLNILTQSEIKSLFAATSYSHKSRRLRLRDKAILTLLYSCALRRNETVQLDLKDVYFDRQQIHIRKGKNYKERLVPINSKNAAILEEYIYESRPEFYKSNENEALLINQYGQRLGGMSLANRLQQIVKASGNATIEAKQITPHILRHSIATHLLEKEVPLESIKTFLGHRSLASTQIYVHLLKQV